MRHCPERGDGHPGEEQKEAPMNATATRPTSHARSVEAIYRAPAPHMVGDGFRVAGYFNAVPDGLARLSPFLLLDYHAPYDYAPTRTPRGVGVHPHRGFETVTI